MNKVYCFLSLVLMLTACKNDNKIIRLLSSEKKDDLIEGARMAGNSGSKKYVPLLLKNAVDSRRSTNINFKGTSVYQAKMQALRNIFKAGPLIDISMQPDSAVIKIYTTLFTKYSNGKLF